MLWEVDEPSWFVHYSFIKAFFMVNRNNVPDIDQNKFSPDNKWFVTSLGPEHKIAFYRTADNQLDFTVPVDGTPFVAKFSGDGKYLFDAGHQAGHIRVWKVDVSQRKVVATTKEEIGTNTGAISVNPFSGLLYVSDQASSKMSEIDPATWKVTKQFATDKTPDQIVFAVVRGK